MGLRQIKVKLCSVWGTDRDAANAAWASTYDMEKLVEKTDEEVRRIASNIVVLGHDTPKERVWMDWFVTAPLFTERQFDKYRLTQQFQDIQVECQVGQFGRLGITQNELSGRYRTIPDRPYLLPQDVSEILDRTGRHVLKLSPEDDSIDSAADWKEELEHQHNTYQQILGAMRDAEKSGVITNAEYKRAREVCRGVLGTAFLTDMRLVMNLNAFEHVINQRIDVHAQVESQVFAYLLLQEVRKNEVAKTIVETMVVKNGWQVHIDRIEDLLARETGD